MKNDPIKISDFEIDEVQLENLATEFYGTVVYPAGNHQMAWLSFSPDHDHSREDLRQQFIRALQSYRKKIA